MVCGFIYGCRFRGREGIDFSISHLLFADDMIVFCEASEDQLLYLSWVLFWFEVSSGLKINLDKSILFPVGEVVNVADLVVELGCHVGRLLSTYLGLPLAAAHKSVAVWDSIEERIRKMFACWKRNYSLRDKEYSCQPAFILDVPSQNACLYDQEIGKDVEKLPLGRRGPREETSFN